MPTPPPPPAAAAPANAPTTAATPATPGAAPAAPAKSDDGPPGPRHYVTLGTFVRPADAEAMRARLDAQGIPTVLEARLRVGPYATREEAQAAQARLKELGFAPGAVLSPRR
jgi:DedD protein